MAATNSGILYITYVEKQGSFLKIWGQMDRNLPVIIEKSLTQMTPQFDSGMFMPTIDGIQCGLLCCAKYKDGAYYRARITNIGLLHQNVVEVHFVDYGNKDMIPIVNLRTIGTFAPGLITIPPQARDFILANVTYHGSSWDNDTIALISSEIRYMELTWVLLSQINGHALIKLFKNGEDVALSFFNRGMVLSIATAAQHVILQNIGGNTTPMYQLTSSVSPPIQAPQVMPPVQSPVQVMTAPPPALLTYKAVSLEPGTENHVYISYVSDGPCHFSVQLKKLEDTLARLMKELNRMNLQPLEDDPIPGTVCVARCIEDEHICRAVVTSMVDGQYKVFYVDFGNTEIVPLDNLYQIPFKYVIPKVMAMRYALAGLERSSVTVEMKCAFKEFVSDKLLRMRALPPPTRSALPLCQLWDDKNINLLDVLRQAALLAYPEVIQLTRGFSQEIRVSYVQSCSHFYVQIKSKEEDLRKVMADLQSKCPHTNHLSPSEVKVGLPCCALFDADGQWYRAQILNTDGETVKVRYVDYGNEELVMVNNLRMPPAEQLTALRPQALECCLNGYQNMADDLERDNILEEIILEKEFVMKVVEMQGNRALVDLIDSSRYNVGSLLLERLATAKSQVSPLLIQESHNIEHRKRNSPVQQKFENRSMRSDQNDKGWGNEDKGKKSWNNEDKDRNTNRQDSWRDNRPPRKDFGDERNGGDGFDRNKGRKDGFKKDWGGDRDGGKKDWGERDGFKKEWGGGGGEGSKKDSWDGGREDGFKKDNRGGSGGRDNFKKDNWGGGGGGGGDWKRGGRSPNQREGSEKSFSDGGSEKNWRRNPRTNNEDRRPKRQFDSGNKNSSSWNSTNQESKSNFATVVDPAPSSAVFVYPELNGKSEKVLISWFHDPGRFFCQLQEFQTEFRTMMNNIQTEYSNIQPGSASVGAPVIALFPDDGVMYRACVLEVKGMQYRVQYIDFGNVANTNKVWPIENKYMKLSAQAICCSLNGIVPLGDKWEESDALSSYFDKECFMCNFISSENQNYSVELTCDNQSVGEGLVTAGLAQYIQIEEPFDPSVLLGQQMRVILGDVQSLDAFYVQLQNGIHILCSMHNLAVATQTYEETLKGSIGSILIMYIDNVLEDRSEITLYDTNGAKLKIVEPDEGAYDTIEALCPLPVFSYTIHGWISYLKPGEGDKYCVFIQPPEYADTLAQLLEDLFNHYDAKEEAPIQPEVGLTYAVHSSDGNWYRGHATSVEDETVTVRFVDYGNSESVAVTELRELTVDFMQQNLMALELTASGIDETFIEQEVSATVWYGDNGWEAEIQKAEQSIPQTEVIEEEIISEPQLVQPVETEIVPEEIAPPAIEQVLGVSIILSHIDSPSEFYVQLSEDIDTINNLQEALQEQVSAFPDLETPVAGVLCAAPYSVDQQWYRAQVLDADVDITTVRFVDYGNTDVLTNVANHVKTLPSDLLSLEQHARRCSLIIKPADVEWSPAAFELFETLTTDKNLSAEIVHQDEKTTYIELFAEAQNIAEILLEKNLAVKLQLETEASCTGYVSNLNSPSEFWVQLENSVADLEWIAEQLSAAENFPELEDLTPGSLCAALFPDDEMWYRARILSNTIAGLEVLFIDYGNSCTCTGLRQLPEDLIMLPALAQKCSLLKPQGILQWSSEATDEFRTTSADGATVFNIDRLSTGETSIVKLILDGVDIATTFAPKTEDVSISHFESISSFWVRKVEDMQKLSEIVEKLTTASEWPKYEPKEDCKVVAALNSEDQQWYRAHVLSENNSEYEVLFIDVGKTLIVSDIRMSTCDIEKESPLANKCRLEPLPGYRWNDESSEKFNEISNNGATIFQMEVVAADSIRLYLNGSDIRSDLDSTYVSSTQNTPRKAAMIHTDPAIAENFINTDSELVVITETDAENSISIDQEFKINENNTELETSPVSADIATNVEIATEDLKLPSKDINELEEVQEFNKSSESTKDVEDLKLPSKDNIELKEPVEELNKSTESASTTKLPPEEDIELNEPVQELDKSTEFAGTTKDLEFVTEDVKDFKLPPEEDIEFNEPVQELDKSTESAGTTKDLEFVTEDVKDCKSPSEEDMEFKEPVEELNKSTESPGSTKDVENGQASNDIIEFEEQTEDLNKSADTKQIVTDSLEEEYEETHKFTESATDNELSEEIPSLEAKKDMQQPLPEVKNLDNEEIEKTLAVTELTEQVLETSSQELEKVPTVTDEDEKKLDDEVTENMKTSNTKDDKPQPCTPTPHADKIVPGSICRGDLTKVLYDDNELTNLEKEIQENGQCDEVVTETSEIKSVEDIPVKVKSTDDIPYNIKYGKIANDERIVPGTVSRGETPEPSQIEQDNVVISTVNGIEVKENVLS